MLRPLRIQQLEQKMQMGEGLGEVKLEGGTGEGIMPG